MEIITEIIQFETRGFNDIIDITNQVSAKLMETSLKEGNVTIFAIGSTTGISTIEYEPGLVKSDLKAMMDQIAPYGFPYKHNQTWGDDNGGSHLRSTLIGPSFTVPFKDGTLLLGTWQQIIFIDFDTRPRNRKVVLQYLGNYS